jgi:hypothetical protein
LPLHVLADLEEHVLRVGIVALLKNEQRLVGEFIAHHLGIGIDRIHLFDGQASPLTRRIIERAAGVYSGVTVETWDGTRDEAHERALALLHDDVDWLLPITCDEFLVSPNGANLTDFLQQMETFAAIGLHRASFGSSGLAFAPDDLFTASLVRRAPDVYGPNRHVKSLVRPGRMRGVQNAHVFISDGCPYFNCQSEELSWIHPGLTANYPVLSPFRLNHYCGRYPDREPTSGNRSDQNERSAANEDWAASDYNNTLDRSALRYVPRTLEIMAGIGITPDGREKVKPRRHIFGGALKIWTWRAGGAKHNLPSDREGQLGLRERLVSQFDVCLNIVADSPMIGDSLCMLPLALELAETFQKKIHIAGNYNGAIKPLVEGWPISFDGVVAPGCIQFNAGLSEANEFARANNIHLTQAFFVLAKMALPSLPITLPLHAEPCDLPPGIVICPFTASDAGHVKGWYAERWIAVIDALAKAGKTQTFYLVGAEGEPYHLYDHPLVVPISGRPLPYVLDLMRGSLLVMSVDTSLSHLAHFGSVARHLLLYPQVNPATLGTNPRGKFIHGWPVEISPEMVIAAALEMLG